ncbi:MAG TPA: SgcJ/EcaC family oxidoreductase [Thermoanaerobaculia bacterium]
MAPDESMQRTFGGTPRRAAMSSHRLMNRLFAAVAGLLACIGCATSGSTSDAASQILRLDTEWSQAAQRRDADRVVSFWADDATVFPPGSPPVIGKSAIREFVAKSFQTPGFSISWKTTSVVVSRSGDFAYATGTNRVTFSGAEGKQVAMDGKAVTVWRREPGGVWKCVIDIWNDVSPPSR